MKRLLLILGLQLLAFWEVWHWYVTRAVYSWEQPWGVAAFVAAILFLIGSRKPLPQSERSLWFPAALILVYAATYFVLPPLARALIAFTAVAATVSLLRFGRPFMRDCLACSIFHCRRSRPCNSSAATLCVLSSLN